MGAPHTKLSPECLETLKDEGFTPPQIAEICGCSRQNVYQRWNKIYKVPIKDEITFDLWRRGRTIEEIASKTDYTYHGAREALKRLNLKPNRKSHQNHNMIILLRNKGFTVPEIAQELKMQIMSIWKTLKKYNLKPAPGQRGPVKGEKMAKSNTKLFLIRDIPPATWRKFKIQALERGVTMNSLFLKYIHGVAHGAKTDKVFERRKRG